MPVNTKPNTYPCPQCGSPNFPTEVSCFHCGTRLCSDAKAGQARQEVKEIISQTDKPVAESGYSENTTSVATITWYCAAGVVAVLVLVVAMMGKPQPTILASNNGGTNTGNPQTQRNRPVMPNQNSPLPQSRFSPVAPPVSNAAPMTQGEVAYSAAMLWVKDQVPNPSAVRFYSFQEAKEGINQIDVNHWLIGLQAEYQKATGEWVSQSFSLHVYYQPASRTYDVMPPEEDMRSNVGR